MKPSPLHLYVHIPFCVHKCAYCDFNSHERNAPDWEGYRAALLAELKDWAQQPQFTGRTLSSIFFGGGTPSLAPPGLIADVIDNCKTLYGLDIDCEISLEANPGTVDAEHFKGYRAAGVNRLSIGVQSLDNDELQWLERIHSREQAISALKTGRAAGFENINLDLIYGLPGQTVPAWLQTLDAAIAMAPEHLSCYQLTVEPHTRLAAEIDKVAKLPDDELALEFFFRIREKLADAGYEAYEISNFAKPGKKCRHNDGYWLYHDYIGIGAGASGKWDMADGGVSRYTNIRNPEKYIDSSLKIGRAVGSDEQLSKRTAEAEALWQGLRRSAGISNSWFAKHFGADIQTRFGRELAPWLLEQKLVWDGNYLRLTDKGLPFADSIAAELF